VRYRKKPVEVEAMQYRGEVDIDQLREFVGIVNLATGTSDAHIVTLEGWMRVSDGDYVIRGVQGECYPCKPDIFAATYEPVDASDR
jgi:hypothetical protein